MPEDLVGPAEIAARLGVSPGLVRLWRHRGLMPEPVAVVSRAPVWEWADVAAWAQARRAPGDAAPRGAPRS